MCKVRFGPTGMHFYDLDEPITNRPLIGHKKAESAALPSAVKKLEIGVGVQDVDEKPKLEDTAEDVLPGGISREVKGRMMNSSSSLSDLSSSYVEGRRLSLAEHVNESPPARANKRDRDSSSSSESSPSSSSSSSSSSSCSISVSPSSYGSESPPSSVSSLDEDHFREAFKRFSKERAASKQPKLRSTHSRSYKTIKSPVLKSCLKPSKPLLAKKVRFAMPVEERITPGDDVSDGSSHSSYDSYTDPPPPPSGSSRYSHGASVRKAHKYAARMAKVAEFLGSENGSYVDISEVPVRAKAPNLARTSRKDRIPATSHAKANAKPKGHTKRARKTAEDYFPWDLESVAESNVDDGQGPTQLYQKPVYLRSHKPWTAKLRSGEPIPEPIFILRTDPITYRNEKSRPSVALRASEESSDNLRDQFHGRRPSLPRPSRTKVSKKSRSSAYEPPTVEDGSENDVQTGVRFRDV